MKDNNLRDELIGLEKFTPTLREKYERGLKDMVEKRLKPWERVWWIFWALWGFGFMVGFAAVALFVGPDLAWQGRMCFGFGSLFGALWMISCILIVKKGSFHQKRDSAVLGGITWTFLVIMAAFSLVQGGLMEDTTKGILMVVSSLTFLLMFGLGLTWGRIANSELRLRENILRLELQLVELTQNLTKEK